MYVAEEEAAGDVNISLVHKLLTAPKNAKNYHNRRWNCTITSITSALTTALEGSEPIAHAIQEYGCVFNASQIASQQWNRRTN